MDRTLIESPYIVSFEDADDVPVELRIRAESRYSASLEKAFGGAQGVMTAHQAFRSSSEADEVPTGDSRILALAWQKATHLAHQAGMRELGEDSSAYFAIRV